MPNPKSWFGRGNTRALLISGAILALFVSTSAFAVGEGEPVEGGERNPTANLSQAYQKETEIIGDIAASNAQKGGYVTRQSNTSTGANAGGGAIYGCRSTGTNPDTDESCIRANNLADGLAFSFNSNGTLGGLIQVGDGGREEKPFVTDATGVATGLNADEVDGLDAEQLIQANQQLFARVNADASAFDGRGATAAATGDAGDGVYTVTFNRDISGCAYQATQVNTELPGTISAALTPDTNNTVTVRTLDEAEDPFTDGDGDPATDDNDNPDANGNAPADRAFHLTVTC